MLQDRPTDTRRLYALVLATPEGILARTGATTVGVSVQTACGMLARLYWAGLIDRHRDGARYRYTKRPPRPAHVPRP